jgi:hypothetical protein
MRRYTPAAKQSYLVRACDSLWRKIILLRAKGRCQMCGISKPKKPGAILWIQAAHIIGRRYWFLRWDKRNGLAVCGDCHVDPMIVEWLEANDPGRLAWLREQRNRNMPQRDINLREVYDKLIPQVLGGMV